MKQLTLPYQLAHRDDPQTSYEAAEKLVKLGKLTKQEQQVLNGIKSFLKEFRFMSDFTAKELKVFYLDYYVTQRRLSGLRNKGKIDRLNTKGGIYIEGKGQELMKRDNCAVWRLL